MPFDFTKKDPYAGTTPSPTAKPSTSTSPTRKPVQLPLFQQLKQAGLFARIVEAGRRADERLRKAGIYSGATLGANRFLDPKVIRDMAISIAGSVAQGVIDARNFTSSITDKFGSGARRVARQVYRRAQGQMRHAASTGTLNARTLGPNAVQAASIGVPPPTTAVATTTPQQQAAAALDQREKEIWERMMPATKTGEDSLLEKGRKGWQSFKAFFDRQYFHLAHGARFAELRQRLNFVAKSQGTSQHKAAQAIIDQLEKLDEKEYIQFLKVVVYNDMWARVMQQTAEGTPVLDKDLWWGIKDKHELANVRAKVRADARANPKVTAALDMRQQMWPNIRKEYIAAMKKAGVDVSKSIKRKDYFRHRVMKHQDAKMAGKGGGSRFKLPTARGWLKKAQVNIHDYSLDYIRSEFEVLNEMMYDTARAKFIGWLKDESGHNIDKQLMRQAAAHNKAVIMPTFARMARYYNRKNRGRGVSLMTAESMYQKMMRLKPRDPSWRKRLTKRLAGAEYVGSLEKALNTFAKDTHDIYRANDKDHFYLAATIPDALARAIAANGTGQVLDTQLKKILAKGQRQGQMVLPKEVVKTLQEFMQGPTSDVGKFVDAVSRWPLNKWKQLKLIHPAGVLKYNLRNLSGDLERVLAVNPHAVAHVGKSLSDIYDFVKTGKMPSPEFQEWWERGGMDSNLQEAEAGDIDRLAKLKRKLVDPDVGAAKKTLRLGVRGWNALWRGLRTGTNMREGILRYATFLEYQQQIAASTSGRPKNFGASRREEVMALRSRNDRAYKLLNDLMLAYDEVGVAGQELRKRWIPFWSFQEQNARAYKRIMVNAWKDGRTSALIGRAIVGKTARVGAYTMMKLASTSMRLLMLKTLTELWNNYAYDDEEEDLPESVRKSTHIILGRDSNGKVRVFSRLGTIDDLLEWGGLDAAPFYAREYMNGRMDFADLKDQMIGHLLPRLHGGIPVPKAAFNKVWQSITPYIKTTAELGYGKTSYPDFFKQREIRDTGEYIARELNLLAPYKGLIKKPQPSFWTLDKLSEFMIYKYDPNETQYNSFRYDKVAKWAVENGHDTSGGGMSLKKSAEALYDIRMAIRYDDQGALAAGIQAYKDADGTKQNLKKSIQRLHPLGSLTNKKLKKEFEDSLTAQEKRQLEKAVAFWEEQFHSKETEVMDVAQSEGLPAKKKKGKK